MRTLFIIALRNIGRNRRRTVLCIAAIAVAVFFNVFLQSWMGGMIYSMEDVVRTFNTGDVLITSKGYEENKDYSPVQYPVSGGAAAAKLVSQIEALPGVKAALPRIQVYATLQDNNIKHAALWGIEAERESTLNHFNLTKRNNGLVEGRFAAKNKNECAVGYEFAQKGGFKIGDDIPLKVTSAQFSDKFIAPVITGIYNFDYAVFDEDTIIMDFDKLSQILVLEGGAQQIAVFAQKREASGKVAAEIKAAAALDKSDVVQIWQDNYWVAFMNQSMRGMYIVYIVFQIVASFLIINTVLMVIYERIKEIGMMGALGLRRGEIVAVFFLEAVILSVLGAAAGCFIGGVSTGLASLFPISTEFFTGGGLKEYPMSGTLFVAFSPAVLLQGFVFGVVVSSLCTLIPSLKSAFIEPVEALRR